MSDLRIPQSAVFYVRSAIQRTMIDMEQQTKSLEGALADQDIPTYWAESLKATIAYNRQWMTEAKKEFEALPDELYPHTQF